MFLKFLQSRLGQVVFLAFIAIEVAFLIWDITGRHMVLHDTLGGFFNLYYRFNSIVEYGQVPLWTPFMTQGSSIPFLNGPGFGFDLFVFLWALLKRMDFFSLFYTGMFLYQLFFLAGVWLLSGRYFASVPSRAFLMVCVASGLIAYTQLFWLSILYVVPLVIWLLYRFMDSGRWRWFFFAAYIYLTQSVSTNPYSIPVSMLAISMYFVFDICGRREYYQRQWASLQFGRSCWACMAGIVVMAVLAWVYMHLILDPYTVVGNYLRNDNGTVLLSTFLTYAGNTDLNKWNELILRVSPAKDFTLYMGMFALPCVIAAILFDRRSEARAWVGWTAVMFLFSIGSVVAAALFYFWPLMKFYRHLCLLAPVVKLGLCFLAGFGFDVIFCSDQKKWEADDWSRRVFFFTMAVLFAGVSLFLYQLMQDAGLRNFILGTMVTEGLPSFHQEILRSNLYIPMAVAGGVAAFCSMMVFVRTPRMLAVVALVCLAYQALDVYVYRAAQTRLRTVTVDQKIMDSMRWQTLPWRATRDPNTWMEDGRADILKTRAVESALYNGVGNFVWRDYFSTPIRTDQWQKGLDNYLRAYMGMPFNGQGAVNAQTPYMLYFNLGPAALKISGVTQDKVQVFDAAYYLSSPEKVAAAITDKRYAGDVLFLSSYEGRPVSGRPDDPVSAAAISSYGRLDALYRVTRFSPNEVIIEAEAPVDRPAWLLYSDIWHPNWKAEVNAKAVPVYAANLAYKAVPLVPGKNVVRFYFHAPLMIFFYWFFAVQGVIAMGILGWMFLTNRREYA